MAANKKTKSIKQAAEQALKQDTKQRGSVGDSFINGAARMGIGADNLMSGGTYGFNPITRNRTLLEWIHRGSWIGGRAVDIVADDMTRAGVDIKGEILPKQVAALEEQAVHHGVWNALSDTVKWSRLYGGSVAIILIDGQDPLTPLRLETIRRGQFQGLLPLDRWMVEPSMHDLVQELGQSFGLPKFYSITANAPGLSRMRVHHSRVVRLEGIRLPFQQRMTENMWGLSVIERLYDRLIAYDSASTGAAQMVFKAYIRTYKIDGLREVLSIGGDALEGLQKQVNLMTKYQSQEGITLMDNKDTFEGHETSTFSGLSDLLAQFGQQISGALEIPLARLFGQSPMGFSTGDTDMRNYYDSVRLQQERTLRVGVTKVYRIMAASAGIPLPEGTTIEFKSLWQLDDKSKTDIASTNSNTILAAEAAGIITRATALRELQQQSSLTGIFSNVTSEMIKEAELELPPLPETGRLGAPGAAQSQAGDQAQRNSASAAAKTPSDSQDE